MSITFQNMGSFALTQNTDNLYRLPMLTDAGWFNIQLSTIKTYFTLEIDARVTTLETTGVASNWPLARTLTLGGVASGSTSFDGSADFSLNVAVVDGALSVASVGGLGLTLLNMQNDITDLQAQVGAGGTLTPRNIALSGDGSWSVLFDGSADVSAPLVLANTGIVAGTYSKITVDSKGRAVVGEQLTAADIGLSFVNNTADLDKPLSTAAISALAGKVDTTLFDVGGLIKSEFLPSYVDDVLEFDSLSVFPTVGEASKIYLDLATNLQYRWSGTVYIDISSGGTADAALKLTNARTFSITGPFTAAPVSFDGTANVELAVTVADDALAISKIAGLQAALSAAESTATTLVTTNQNVSSLFDDVAGLTASVGALQGQLVWTEMTANGELVPGQPTLLKSATPLSVTLPALLTNGQRFPLKSLLNDHVVLQSSHSITFKGLPIGGDLLLPNGDPVELVVWDTNKLEIL